MNHHHTESAEEPRAIPAAGVSGLIAHRNLLAAALAARSDALKEARSVAARALTDFGFADAALAKFDDTHPAVARLATHRPA